MRYAGAWCSVPHEIEDDGAEDNQHEGGQNEEDEGEEQLLRGLGSGFLGFLEALFADEVGLDAQHAADADAHLACLDQYGEEGRYLTHLEALRKTTQSVSAGGAEFDLAQHFIEFRDQEVVLLLFHDAGDRGQEIETCFDREGEQVDEQG